MPADYPTSLHTWTDRSDNVSPVVADDVNSLYAEVSQIEATVGVNPHVSPTWGLATFTKDTTAWTTVKARLDNIEAGVYSSVYSRVDIAGGSTITQGSTSTVGLTITAASGSTANLLNFKNSSGTVVTAVTPGGFINVINGGTA
jgi:hypothetical protein